MSLTCEKQLGVAGQGVKSLVPISKSVAPVNPDPAMTMGVPPAEGPSDGVAAVTAGGPAAAARSGATTRCSCPRAARRTLPRARPLSP